MSKIKQIRLIVFTVMAAALVMVTGCGKSAQEPKSDTQTLEGSFSAAAPAAKSLAEMAAKFIQAADYGNAADTLQKLLQDKTLTSQQALVVSNAFQEVSKHPRLAP